MLSCFRQGQTHNSNKLDYLKILKCTKYIHATYAVINVHPLLYNLLISPHYSECNWWVWTMFHILYCSSPSVKWVSEIIQKEIPPSYELRLDNTLIWCWNLFTYPGRVLSTFSAESDDMMGPFLVKGPKQFVLVLMEAVNESHILSETERQGNREKKRAFMLWSLDTECLQQNNVYVQKMSNWDNYNWNLKEKKVICPFQFLTAQHPLVSF